MDGTNLPDIIALNSASAALSLSDIPWNGPIGAVRVGYSSKNQQFIINPNRKELSQSSLNLVLAGTRSKLTVMLEAEGSNFDKSLFVDGIYHGLEACQLVAEAILKETSASGKAKRPISSNPQRASDLNQIKEEMSMLLLQKLYAVYSNVSHDKISRDKAAFAVRDKAVQELRSNYPEMDPSIFYEAFNLISRTLVADMVIDNGMRVDGRRHNQLRNIGCQADLHAPLHGSALFQRGQTQVMCTVALDSLDSALKSDTISVLLG